ncbi:MAG: lysozyme inhibitor LprI family protein, partial [Pseudomonadota bacterium]
HPQRPAYYDEVVGAACLSDACEGTRGLVPVAAVAAVESVAALPTVPEREAPAAKPAPAATAQQVEAEAIAAATDRAAREWGDFRTSNSLSALGLFVERHQGTAYAALAEERIAALVGSPVEPAGTERAGWTNSWSDEPQYPRVTRPRLRPEDLGLKVVDYRPSYDCRAVTSETELAICGDRELSKMDRLMATLYVGKRAEMDKVARSALTESQKTWLTRRDACGADAFCLAERYRSRIAALQAARTEG